MNLNNKSAQWGLLLFIAFIWGSSFILIDRGLKSFTDLQVSAFRIFISFLVLIPFIIRSLKKLDKKNIIPLLVVGFIGNGIPAFLFSKGQTEINSALAGMLNSTVPIFTLIVGLIFFSTKVKLVNIIGLTIGLTGALGLIFQGENDFMSGKNWYMIFIIIATICYSINLNIIKYKLDKLDSISIIALAFLFIGPPAGLYLLFSDFSKAALTPDWGYNLFYISLLAIFGSATAVILFNVLIKHTTTIFSASVTYVIPVFAIGWGILNGEKIGLSQIFWIVIIILDVYLVNKNNNKNADKKIQ